MTIANGVLQRLGMGRGPGFSQQLLYTARRIDAKKTLLPKDVKLKDIDDANEVIVPVHCKLEQLANYIDSNTILINGEFWSAMDAVSKAALIVHESVYLAFREGAAASNSFHARKAVAYGFAGAEMQAVDDGVPASAIHCETQSDELPFPSTLPFTFTPTEYWIYPDSNPDFLVVQFDKLDGILMLTKTRFLASRRAFDRFGGFRRYYTHVYDSIIEKGLPIGFKDVTLINENTVISARMVGAVNSWQEPSVPTGCSY